MTVRRASILFAAVLALAVPAVAAPAASAAVDQLQVNAVATFELQPARGVVHVTVVYDLKNQAPSKSRSYSCPLFGVDPVFGGYEIPRTCTVRTDYYYNGYRPWVERDAKALKVKADHGSASVKPGKREGNYREAVIKFSNLFYGRTVKLTLTYDLPAGGPRSSAIRRVGYVYSSFCAAGPSGDKGMTRVVVPSGYKMALTKSMKSSTKGGKTTYSSPQAIKPWQFYTCLSGTNDKGYARTAVKTSTGQSVNVEAWREDTKWAGSVRSAVAHALPSLGQALGPLEDGGVATIRERRAGDVPWSGSYDSTARILGLSERVASEGEVTHRLAQLWFDPKVFAPTWLREGYAGWAEHAAGLSQAPCTKPTQTVRLDFWSGLSAAPTAAEIASDRLRRQAACDLVSTIATTIGPERMAATIAAMRNGLDAFGGDTAVKRERAALSWQEWLDIVTERGLVPAGADPDLATNLLVAYGVTNDQTKLEAHAAAIRAYRELVTLTGGHVPPAVTGQLSAWNFGAANAAMTSATEAWTAAGSVHDTLPDVVVEGGKVQQAVTSADSQDQLEAARTLATTQAKLAGDAADAIALAHAPRDPIETIGLIGTAIPAQAEVVDAVTRIDADPVAALTGQIRSTIGAARDAGIQRLAIGLGVLLLIALVAGVGLWRRRSVPPPPAIVEESPQPVDP
jgi:hypothetical protein